MGYRAHGIGGRGTPVRVRLAFTSKATGTASFVPVRTSVVRAVVKFVLAALVIIVVVHVPRRDPIESEVVIKSEHRTGVSVNGMDGVARYTCKKSENDTWLSGPSRVNLHRE